MNQEIKDKIIAGAVALFFMALVRPDRVPELWQIALITIGIYECALMAIRIARQQRRENRIRENRRIRKIEGRRLEKETFRKAN